MVFFHVRWELKIYVYSSMYIYFFYLVEILWTVNILRQGKKLWKNMLTWIYFIPSDEDKLIDSNASQIFNICKVQKVSMARKAVITPVTTRAVPILSVSAVSAILESIGIGKIIPKFADTADTLKKMSDLHGAYCRETLFFNYDLMK